MRTIFYTVLAFYFCLSSSAVMAQDGEREPVLLDADAAQEGVEGRIYRARNLTRYDRLLELANGGETDPTLWTITPEQFDAANACYVNFVCIRRGDRSGYRRNGSCGTNPTSDVMTWDTYQDDCRERGGYANREVIAGHRYFVPMDRRETATETVSAATGVLQTLAEAPVAPTVQAVDAELARLAEAGMSDDAPPDFRAAVPAIEAVRRILPRVAIVAPPVRGPRTEPVAGGDRHTEARASDPGSLTGASGSDTPHDSSGDAEPNPFLHPLATSLYGFGAAAILLSLIFGIAYWRLRRKLKNHYDNLELEACEKRGFFHQRVQELASSLQLKAGDLLMEAKDWQERGQERWQNFLILIGNTVADKQKFEKDRTALDTSAQTKLDLLHGLMKDAEPNLDVNNLITVKGFFSRLKETASMVAVWPFAERGELSAKGLQALLASEADLNRSRARLIESHAAALVQATVNGQAEGYAAAQAEEQPKVLAANENAAAATALMEEANGKYEEMKKEFEAFRAKARLLVTSFHEGCIVNLQLGVRDALKTNEESGLLAALGRVKMIHETLEGSKSILNALYVFIAPELAVMPAPALAGAGAPTLVLGGGGGFFGDQPITPRTSSSPPGVDSDSVVKALEAGVVPAPDGTIAVPGSAEVDIPQALEVEAPAPAEAPAAVAADESDEDEIAGEPTQVGMRPERPRRNTDSYDRKEVLGAAPPGGNGNGAHADGLDLDDLGETGVVRPRKKTLPVFAAAPTGEVEPDPRPAPSEPPPPADGE